MITSVGNSPTVNTYVILIPSRSPSPPQRLLLVNISERNKREAGEFLPSATVGGLCGGERVSISCCAT